MGERQPAKHHAPSRRKRRLSGRKESSSSVFFRAGGRGHAQTQAARRQFGKPAAAAFLPALFYRLRGPLSSRFFKRSGQRIGFAASQCVQSTHNLKAQPGFEDCCAKNKSGYLRIRATAVKERIEAVTNGQGRQGREDLQDQARPRRRNRLPSARAVRGVPRSDRETSTRADGVATTRA